MHPSRRLERRAELIALLGEWPDLDRSRPPEGERVFEDDSLIPGAVVEHWRLDLNGLEPVPAYVCRPAAAAAAAAAAAPALRPGILYNHYHGGDYGNGKNELIAVPRDPLLQTPPYGGVLAARGWISLAIDHWAFGERRRGAMGNTEQAIAKRMLWDGRSLWGMMVWDSLRALDWLAARSDVDASRLGTMGLSMGSTMAWWLAAIDPRLRACVDFCCATDFEALMADDGLDRHGIYYYTPGLLRHGFTAGEIAALAAPCARLSLNGDLDPLTPPEGLDRIDREARAAYAMAGKSEAWQMIRERVDHRETAAMRAAALAWLERWL